ncbi:MAG: hypothetical protein A2790_16130 [Phenylobacterium sp. RIFCSPHIGHO2_01_FULL_69_31]|uniref:toll/interleukin-1 receptor domain-containing protein n=1 Tax=Phenylobacterium sp. RIFCSPHIGHO2_01_FULL_69_31 TaxID=1801944 RepID=UPI0008C0D080|nr:toll/interleukin-1 receptor domain-containing protein [Phenylobacterium sp. RIFCSPHIGHO2_01_FULL_69_31]OHB28534.1 MAG: hypothetical protein A2790_16130 [Phenylobacterium sp. RIFCSPHIGHO2_01_FULL_69_31]
MPVFISYSQADRAFVDTLAANLVMLKHNIWVDRWELKVGDSLTEKIEQALTASSAVMVVISKNSIESGWCRRELNAVLVREIEEKRSIIIPCRIDDCEMPLFLRDKLYADFRTDPDKALRDVNAALLTVSNPFQERFEDPEFITDWSVDWRTVDHREAIEHTFVDHGQDYVVVSNCTILCGEAASANFLKHRARGEDEIYIAHVLDAVVENLETSPLKPPPIITDHFKKFVAWRVRSGDETFDVVFDYRRLGKETGFDTVIHLDNNLKRARQHMREIAYRPRPPD